MKQTAFIYVLINLIFMIDVFSQCDYFEDFSDPTNWTKIGTLVEVSQGQLNYIDNCPDASQRRVYKELANPISNADCWELTMAFLPTSVGSLNGDPFTAHLIFSLTENINNPLSDCQDIQCAGFPPSTQDMISISYSAVKPTNGELHFKLIASKKGIWETSDLLIYSDLESIIYVNLLKDCSQYTLNIFSDPNLENPLGNGPVIMNIKAHDTWYFIQHGNTVIGQIERELNGYIDDVCIDYIQCPQVNDSINYTGCYGDMYSIEINETLYNEINPNGVELLPSDLTCDTVLNVNLIFEDCSIEEEVERCIVLIPNAFTPNNDGINDSFKIFFSSECLNQNYEIVIFNRWGELIFKGDQSVYWNGFANEKMVDIGVYIFSVKYYNGSEYIIKNGNITLIK